MYKPKKKDSDNGKLEKELNAKLSMKRIIVIPLVH